ncbi:zinc finger matrin-type protein 1-like [Lagenorhynchus albirostris]|uniref:zinc finger matrin-type protein 1-like n=1 Tax=Lagenorhynchus albirostris TaxID=27610 RepID=UPI0028F0C33D|nr:zinc finger matrin-type protein 1-like [Lagenorhynchus albirostris]
MENSKTYDSFQHELQDYIRKQRARGLQPEVCFRKGTEDSVSREKDHTAPRPPMLERRVPFRRPHKSPRSYKRPKTVERRLPTLSNSHHFRQRLEPVNHCQKKHDHFFNIRWFPSPPVRGMTIGPHTAQHREEASCFSEDHTGVHQAGDQDGGWTGRSREKGGGHGNEEQVSWKRKHHRDEEETHKEDRRKARVVPGSTEKSKYRKKSTHDWDPMKEGRRSSREKKHPGKRSTHEWDLWDEAVLGGCY